MCFSMLVNDTQVYFYYIICNYSFIFYDIHKKCTFYIIKHFLFSRDFAFELFSIAHRTLF